MSKKTEYPPLMNKQQGKKMCDTVSQTAGKLGKNDFEIHTKVWQ